MKKTLSLVIAMLCTTPLWAQQKDSTDTQKVFAASDLGKPGILLKRANKGYIQSVQAELLQHPVVESWADGRTPDTLILTEKEKAQLKHDLKAIQRFSWSKKQMAASGLSMHTLVNEAPMPDPQHIDHNRIYEIAKPVFLRNNTICILIYQYNCGPLCGEGAGLILKKQGGQWVAWGTTVRWVS